MNADQLGIETVRSFANCHNSVLRIIEAYIVEKDYVLGFYHHKMSYT